MRHGFVGMGYIVRMANLGMSMNEAEIIEWFVEIGDRVEEGDPLLEVEAEKTTSEIAASESGILRKIYVKLGDTAEPGTALAIIAGADEDISELDASVDQSAVDSSTGETEETSNLSAVQDGEGSSQSAATDQATIRLTPAAKRRARELSVDVDSLSLSGEARVLNVEDIESIASNNTKSRTVSAERDLDGLRNTIAERLGHSYRNAVHVTVDRTVDIERGLDVVDELTSDFDDISVMDLILRAVSEALSEHPEFNATFEDGTHILYEEQNVGIAVDIEDGLITPVLPGVESKELDEIVESRRSITTQALEGNYDSELLSGGTFTISNLGVLDIDSFTPIIDPPQVAILGVGRPSTKAVQDNGVVFRQHLTFSLSFDHRVVDGADAAKFLGTITTHLQSPEELLIGNILEERNFEV